MKGDIGVKELSVRDSGAPHALVNLVKMEDSFEALCCQGLLKVRSGGREWRGIP